MVELPLNRLQVVKNVGVVEFQVVQNGGARAVMHKLAAFVEKRSVVFVGFDHKWGALPQAGGNAEVQGHTADQKAWLKTRAFQNPAQHRGSGGFAMRTGDRQHMATSQEVLRQPLRATGIG